MDLQLKKFRKLAGFKKQSDMASALGVPARRYESWERGEAMMSLEQAYNVTEILNCTLDELCGRTASRPYVDPRQKAINESYELMNEEGRNSLLNVAESMSFRAANRVIEKDRGERDRAALGA